MDGDYSQMIRAIERALARHPDLAGRSLPVNVDGAIAAVCGDLGFDYELGNAIFMFARLPGLIAHVHEERERQKPMRQIDPKDHVYDGPRERRLPETRK
jgi:citrate synthase